MMRTVYMGTFNSEKYWNDNQLAKLPSFNDRHSDNIIMAMDEMLFLFCKEKDTLITRIKFNEAFKNYLCRIGYSFQNNLINAFEINTENKNILKKSTCELLTESSNKTYYKQLLNKSTYLNPYSILPSTKQLCDNYEIPNNLPDIDVVRKVNSKVYSCILNRTLGIDISSIIVDSSEQLEIQGNQIMKEGKFLIKDIFGVSGKGNLLIDSEKMLARVVKYIISQEKNGKKVQFIIEPYMEKEIDFSCHLEIEKNGIIKIVSVQKMINDNFAYQGSCESDPNFLSYLDNNKYFTTIEAVGKELFKEGYFGNVCIDSMMLKSKRIIPIIEINARKSMGLINYYIDLYLSQFSVKGNLSMLSVGFSKNIEFNEILEKMEEEKILFLPKTGKGILPLSSNALLINGILNSSKNKTFYKGRFYFSAVSNETAEKNLMKEKLKILLKSLGFIIYNG